MKLFWYSYFRRSFQYHFIQVVMIALALTLPCLVKESVRLLQEKVSQQATDALGADAVIRSTYPLADGDLNELSSLGRFQKRISFDTMLMGNEKIPPKLVEVRAIEPHYPPKGVIKTDLSWSNDPNGIIISSALKDFFGLKPGDSLPIGQTAFKIKGLVTEEPDQILGSLNAQMRIYFPIERIAETNLIQKGSRVSYQYLLVSEIPSKELDKKLREKFSDPSVRITTPREASGQISALMERLDKVLNLFALTSLLLGSVGVLALTLKRIQRQWGSILIWQLLGLSNRTIFSVIAMESIFLGVLGGSLCQMIVAFIVRDLPSIPWGIYWGVILSFISTSIPIFLLMRKSPNELFQESFQGTQLPVLPKFFLILYLLCIFLVSWLIVPAIKVVGGFWIVVSGVALLGLIVFLLLRKLLRVYSWKFSFVGRHSLAGFIFPGGSSLYFCTLLTSAFGLVGVWSAHSFSDFAKVPPGAPNLFITNVSVDQVRSVKEMLTSFGAMSPKAFPVIPMNLVSVDGVPLRDFKKDIPENFEQARRQRLADRQFFTTVQDGTEDYVSAEKGISETFKFDLGSVVKFNLQGIEFETRVGELRSVNWLSLQPNFFFIFKGVSFLKDAPKTYFLTANISDKSVEIQKSLIRSFPNVVMIDVNDFIEKFRTFLALITKVLLGIAGITLGMGAGLIAVIIFTQREERLSRMELWNVLGVTKQIAVKTMATELLFSTIIGSSIGLGLAALGSYLFCRFTLDVQFDWGWFFPYLTIPFIGIMVFLTGWAVLFAPTFSKK